MSERYSGFILPLTMWVLAGLSLGIVFLEQWNDGLVGKAISDNEQFEKRLKTEKLEAMLKYALSTQQVSREGVKVEGRQIGWDGRVYRTEDGIYFSLQDAGALINLNAPTNPSMPGLLERMNIDPKEHRRMIDRLADYVDMDDRVRPAGAEQPGYRNTELSGPANRWMYGQMELLKVLGWQHIEDSMTIIREMTGIWSPGGYINLNAASPEVLSTIPWLSAHEVDKLVALRSEAQFRSIGDFKRRMGRPNLEIDELQYGHIPTGYLRIRVWAGGDERLSEFSIRVTPEAIDGYPWVTAFRSRYHNTLSEEHAEELAFLDL